MGFFNWVMSGLGFEDKEKKSKKSKKQPEDKYANFNLHERIDDGRSGTDNSFGSMSFNSFGVQAESNIIVVSPKSHKEIQQVVDYLKQGQTVAVDLNELSGEDNERILDFLSGALYALNGSIVRWHNDLFLLTPEGRKILKPNE